MKKLWAMMVLALCVGSTAVTAYSTDARSESFWERYFGGSNEEDVKPKHVFLQPDNAGKGSAISGSSVKTKVKNLDDVQKKLDEASAPSKAESSGGETDSKLSYYVQQARSSGEAYERAKAGLKKFEGRSYSELSPGEQMKYDSISVDLRSAERELNQYMNKIEERQKQNKSKK